MADCTDYPTPEESKRFKNNTGSVDEFVTSDSDTFVDQDGGEHITVTGIDTLAENQRDEFDTLAENQRDQFNATFQVQFAYKRIGNISDYVGDSLADTEKLNSYQYPDDSKIWYAPIQGQSFPVVIPSDPSNNSGWSEVFPSDDIIFVFNTVDDFKSGITSDGRVVDTPNGTACKTLGYYSVGDGGGFDYVVQPRSGGYGQNKVIEFPLNSDESIAAPIVSQYTGAIAGILPSAANSDLTKNFNELAGKSFSVGQKIVEIEQKAEYYCGSDLTNYYPVIFIGEGSIISPQPNNYYKRIYPKSAISETLSINNSNGSDLGRFLAAVERRNNGGTNPVWVWVGDSITQGAHRASDNYWYVKDFERKLVESFGPIDFYNRGVAGSAISQLDQVVQNSSPINAPFEPQWNVDSGKILRDYVAELNPDCISVAYGMNSGDSAVDTNAIITARTNLTALIPNADIVWISSPIRTTDLNPEFGGQKFGTYPNNEQSNHAGMVTRVLSKLWGDYCIDVNRMSNIVQLGQDPVNLRMNRWAGQFKGLDNKFINDQFINVESDSTWTVQLTSANKITSNEMFRDSMVEFTVDASSSLTDDFRVTLRKDPTGDGELLFQFLPTSVRLIAYKSSKGVQATWNVSPVGKKFRIRVIGAEIVLYIDDVATLPDSGSANELYQSMFLAPIEVQVTGSTSLKLTNFLINGGTRSDYRQFIPRLTPYEVFNIAEGDGGNNLNHPNTLGEREMYSQTIYEFVSWVSGKEVPKFTEFFDVVVPNSSGTLKAQVYDGTAFLFFEDFTVSGSTGSSPVVTLPDNLIPISAVSSTLARIGITDQSKRVQVRPNGDVYITDGTGTASWAGSMSYRIE